MTRRNLFATLLAALVAKFAGSKQRPGESRLHFLYRTGTMKYVPFGEWANPIASPTDEDYASGRVKQLGDTITVRLPPYILIKQANAASREINAEISKELDENLKLGTGWDHGL